MLFWWGSVIGSKELECTLQYRAPCLDFTQDLTCEAGGREGKVCVFKNNMLFLYFVAEGPAGCWEGPAPQPGASGVVQLSFHTAFVPSPCLPPQGRTSVGTVPVSLPLQPLPSWMWYDCFSGHSEKMPVENGSISCLSNFFKAKKKRLLNLGTLDLESSLPGVGAGTLYGVYQSALWARYPTWERFDSHPSAKRWQ